MGLANLHARAVARLQLVAEELQRVHMQLGAGGQLVDHHIVSVLILRTFFRNECVENIVRHIRF